MPQPVKWQYYFLDKLRKSLNYKNGLQTNVTPLPIENTPDGWQDKLVNFGRNTKYFGVFRSFTVPLKFVTEGKKVLRHLFYNFGVEAFCSLAIFKLNNAWTYDPYYEGEIDFSKFSDESDYVTANVMEGGLSKLLKAKEDTTFEIPLTGNNLVAVRFTGIDFKSTINYITPEQSTTEASFTLGIQYAHDEGTSIGVITGSSPLQSTANFDSGTDDSRWIINSTESTIVFTYSQVISFTATVPPPSNQTTYEAYFETNKGQKIPITPEQTIVSGDYSFTINLTITLHPGEKLFAIGKVKHNVIALRTIAYHSSEATVTYLSKALPSTIQAKPLAQVYKELIALIAPGYIADSNLLDSRTDLVVTSGDAIRSLPNAVIKTTFSDFFKSAYSILNVGMGVDDLGAHLEELAYFFDYNTLIADLGEVSNFKASVAEDLMYNTIKVGYVDHKYDDVNGKDEFNSTQIYSSPLIRIVKEMDLISPYRADAFGIEYTRANLSDKKTTDSDSDNDVFLIQVEEVEIIQPAQMDVTFFFGKTIRLVSLTPNEIVPGTKVKFTNSLLNTRTFTIATIAPNINDTIIVTVENTTPEVVNTMVHFFDYVPKKGPYDTTPTGLISPLSLFNIELSPKRILNNHANYLNSIYDKLDTQLVTFQSAAKNAELVSSVGGISVAEKSDYVIGTAPKLFLPVYFTFDCNVPIDLVDLMAILGKGYFAFTWEGKPYKGFPIDISIKPADNDTQTFKLLACPDNVLTNLI